MQSSKSHFPKNIATINAHRTPAYTQLNQAIRNAPFGKSHRHLAQPRSRRHFRRYNAQSITLLYCRNLITASLAGELLWLTEQDLADGAGLTDAKLALHQVYFLARELELLGCEWLLRADMPWTLEDLLATVPQDLQDLMLGKGGEEGGGREYAPCATVLSVAKYPTMRCGGLRYGLASTHAGNLCHEGGGQVRRKVLEKKSRIHGPRENGRPPSRVSKDLSSHDGVETIGPAPSMQDVFGKSKQEEWKRGAGRSREWRRCSYTGLPLYYPRMNVPLGLSYQRKPKNIARERKRRSCYKQRMTAA